MSNTFKDRPLWVKSNDLNSRGRQIKHNHHYAGRPRRRWAEAVDENGNPDYKYIETPMTFQYAFLLRDKTWRYVSSKEFYIFNGRSTEVGRRGDYFFTTHARSHKTDELIANIEEVVYINQTFMRKTIEREFRVVGTYPDHCTMDVPLTKASEGIWTPDETHLCFPVIQRPWERYYRNRPDKKDRRQYHSKARRTESNLLREATKNASNGEDMWDDEYESVNTRQKKHNGWWD